MDKITPDIEKGAQLKHVETTDKSVPKIESDVHIKKIDREGFLTDVAKGTSLSHVEPTDKSAPIIDPQVHIKKTDRGAFLKEVESSGKKE